MRVQQRIALPARAMHERRRNEPAARSRRETVVAPTHRARLTLEETNGSIDRVGMRGDDVRRDVRWRERPPDRYRLRRPERQIETTDAAILRAAEPDPVLRAPVVKDGGQVRPDDVARQSQQRRRGAPRARRRVGSEVVVLDARHDCLGVIGLDVCTGEEPSLQRDPRSATPPKTPPRRPRIADASLCSPSEHSPTPRPTGRSDRALSTAHNSRHPTERSAPTSATRAGAIGNRSSSDSAAPAHTPTRRQGTGDPR